MKAIGPTTSEELRSYKYNCIEKAWKC